MSSNLESNVSTSADPPTTNDAPRDHQEGTSSCQRVFPDAKERHGSSALPVAPPRKIATLTELKKDWRLMGVMDDLFKKQQFYYPDEHDEFMLKLYFQDRVEPDLVKEVFRRKRREVYRTFKKGDKFDLPTQMSVLHQYFDHNPRMEAGYSDFGTKHRISNEDIHEHYTFRLEEIERDLAEKEAENAARSRAKEAEKAALREEMRVLKMQRDRERANRKRGTVTCRRRSPSSGMEERHRNGRSHRQRLHEPSRRNGPQFPDSSRTPQHSDHRGFSEMNNNAQARPAPANTPIAQANFLFPGATLTLLRGLFGRFQYWDEQKWEEQKDDFSDDVTLDTVTKFFRASRRTHWKDFKQQRLDRLPREMRQVQGLFEQNPRIRDELLRTWCEREKLPQVEVLSDLMWLEEQETGFNVVIDDEEEAPAARRAPEEPDVILVENAAVASGAVEDTAPEDVPALNGPEARDPETPRAPEEPVEDDVIVLDDADEPVQAVQGVPEEDDVMDVQNAPAIPDAPTFAAVPEVVQNLEPMAPGAPREDHTAQEAAEVPVPEAVPAPEVRDESVREALDAPEDVPPAPEPVEEVPGAALDPAASARMIDATLVQAQAAVPVTPQETPNSRGRSLSTGRRRSSASISRPSTSRPSQAGGSTEASARRGRSSTATPGPSALLSPSPAPNRRLPTGTSSRQTRGQESRPPPRHTRSIAAPGAVSPVAQNSRRGSASTVNNRSRVPPTTARTPNRRRTTSAPSSPPPDRRRRTSRSSGPSAPPKPRGNRRLPTATSTRQLRQDREPAAVTTVRAGTGRTARPRAAATAPAATARRKRGRPQKNNSASARKVRSAAITCQTKVRKGKGSRKGTSAPPHRGTRTRQLRSALVAPAVVRVTVPTTAAARIAAPKRGARSEKRKQPCSSSGPAAKKAKSK